ncbi:MAG: undecaprenyl/decaprenyl-phosphate alpha-N-acetylglucosaminyl 1-phosphate transferase [Clostridia bacterium]|nr:undecaprenyl/decaprenyl-phosphate alpha-N-acetylglucosaminyl 1-phosphate transferase [Clostridia bacterium]
MVLLGCLLSFALCFVLVPPVIALAWRIGAVDVPCDWRRMHCESIPRAGGIAIFVSFAVACAVFGGGSPFLICTLCGGALMLAVGLADDIFCLPAFFKLLFQIAAATAAVFGSGIATGGQAAPAIFWVVMLSNAHNFIDGLDGLFAGCAAIEGVALSLAFVVCGMTGEAMLPLFLALSCLAFRHFNRYPAQIFAGDCGSGTVGFLLGMLSLPLFGGVDGGISMLAPFLLFAYPLTDLFTAVLRRILRGKSPFAADRAHLHHRICAVGLTHPQCGGVLLLITGALGTVGVLIGAEIYLVPAFFASLAAAVLLMRIRRFITDCQ